MYLKIDGNVNEELNNYILLLNDKNIVSKDAIIEKNETKIDDIKTISDTSIWKSLFLHLRISPLWENIFTYMKEFSDDIETVISFINVEDMANQLSKMKISTEKDENDTYLYSIYWKTLLMSNSIKLENYKIILNSNSFLFSDLSLENLAQQKVGLLINYNIINPNENGYESVRNTHKSLIINFVEKNYIKLKDIITSENFDANDLYSALDSKILTDSQKAFLIKILSETSIFDNVNNARKLLELKAQNLEFDITETLLKVLLLSSNTNHSNRLVVFAKNESKFSDDEINEFLGILGGDYAKIGDQSKRATLDINSLNESLLKILERRTFISSYNEEKSKFRVYHKMARSEE